MLNHWVWLSTRKHMKEREIAAVFRYFGDPESAYTAGAERYRQIPGIGEKAIASLCDKSLEEAQQIVLQCQKKHISLLTFQDAGYPRRLKGIADPPMVLYYKGVLPDFEGTPIIGAVGTRSCSEYGQTMALQLGYQLTKAGAVVISGMAEGIDAAVMAGALASGGVALGILGCGVDRVYPASNKKLYDQVCRQGCLLSEYPPGTQPFKWNFPKRNRLISGMSLGVLVIEAPEKSGALITARQAVEQGKELFAVPGNANEDRAKGSNQLLLDGGSVVRCGGDLLERYQARFPEITICDHTCPEPEALRKLADSYIDQPSPPPVKKEKSPKKDKKTIDNPSKPPYIDLEKLNLQLSEVERSIVVQLTRGAKNTDEVVLTAGLSMSKAMSVLTMLELKGIIQRLPGNNISLRE